MAKFKVIISDPATGKSAASEIEGSRAQALIGRSLGEVIDGSALGLGSNRMRISGGCDKNGIPMRPDVHGGVKKHIVLSSGPGFRPTRHGERRRKLVRGRTVTDETYQINFTITKETTQGEAKRATEPKAAAAQPKPKPPKPTVEKSVEKPKTKKAGKKAAKKSK
jgi:small subunit ribosomal protein S6e